jgi:hypothetical protein
VESAPAVISEEFAAILVHGAVGGFDMLDVVWAEFFAARGASVSEFPAFAGLAFFGARGAVRNFNCNGWRAKPRRYKFANGCRGLLNQTGRYIAPRAGC